MVRRVGNARRMRIGLSILMIAAGAVLIWAVNASVSGVELDTAGWILLIAGAVGLLASLIWRGTPPQREREIVER